MPYKDLIIRGLTQRNSQRKRSHGADWRGIAWHFGFACANAYNEESYPDCLIDDSLEFHAPQGEANGRYRIPLCIYCHIDAHPEKPFPVGRGSVSMLIQDIYLEMEFDGGYFIWLAKRKVGELLPPQDRPRFTFEQYYTFRDRGWI
jgi:hypothetical protein